MTRPADRSPAPSEKRGDRLPALPQPPLDDRDVHRWLCGFAAALIPTFGVLLWDASGSGGSLPALGWGVLFVLFAGLVAGSAKKAWVRRRMSTLARPLYGLLLVWTLIGGVVQSFSTEYAVVLLLAYTLTGIGLSVGLERSWPLAVYFGAAMLFVGVGYFGTAAQAGTARVEPLIIFGYLIGIGLVAFVVLSARIQAQRRLAHSRARYRLLAESASDLILLATPSASPDADFSKRGAAEEGVCRYASPAARALLGYAPGELEGRSLDELAARGSRRDVREMLRTVGRTGERQSVTACFARKDGAVVWLEAHGQAVLDPETKAPAEVVLVLRDVTAQRERERELHNARDDARQAAQAARETARAKTTFLAAMSHEVRTPLVSILGFADVLTDKLAHHEDDELAELAGLIRQGGQRLSATLDSVLDLARIEAGAVTPAPRPVPLAAALREAAAQLRPRAEAKDLAFHLDLPEGTREEEGTPEESCCAHVDPALLARIVTSLVTNAVTFTDEGSVTLTARCGRPGQVALVVEDTGSGLASDLRPHLFEEFKQGQAPESEQLLSEGGGLGLFIVARLVEQCGGTLSVNATPGKGSRFTVRLPRAEAPAPAEPDEPAPPGPPTARILVVEDHTDTRRLIKRLLQPPHHVVTAAGPGEALHAARQRPFDVLLLDINLEGHYDGVDLLGKLRALPGYADTPAVAVTAYAFPEDRTRLLEAGFDDYLAKPFVREQLTQRLRVALHPEAAGEERPSSESQPVPTGEGSTERSRLAP